ncbi:hypothetical protein JOC54_002057 [Alkalihalobacillus xiaoxiensis]|uniref:Uncharacterized protein n=1 Tax=Shouchella xiaoxiensis TaxID=766895 RepID=A0ABS2STG4_9BACI|nr:YfzA family protein [Shouchella xiaoxiensis]MBM7838798.1 hypothetical protein [Shouchella xiaoxiensis]
MAAAKQNTHSKWRGVFIPLGILILSQLIFYLFEDTWLLNPGYSPGSVGGRLIESRLFTEWITIYQTPMLNFSTAIIVVVCLCTALSTLLRKTNR